MALTPTHESVAITFAVGGSYANKISSLTAAPGGQLRMDKAHILQTMTDAWEEDQAGACHPTVHELEWLALEGLVFSPALDVEDKMMTILPERWSRLFMDLINAGMPTDVRMSFDMLGQYVLSWVLKLPDGQRMVDTSDVHVEAAHASGWLDHIWPAKVRRADNTNAVFAQLRHTGTVREA